MIGKRHRIEKGHFIVDAFSAFNKRYIAKSFCRNAKLIADSEETVLTM